MDREKVSGARLLLMACFLLLSACVGVDSQVVRVTDVEVAKDLYAGLKRDDVAKLQEIKKNITTQKDDGDSAVTTLLDKTPSFTVPEYLKKYPESRAIGEDYKISGYDVLSITIYEEKDLTIESIRVSADGFISFPLIGRLHVADMNTSQVQQMIARKLTEGAFLLDAHVSVMVTKYEGRKFSVLGAVKTPGNYPLQAREKVLDGISKAGGVSGEGGGSTSASGGEAQEAMVIRMLNPGRPGEQKIVINVDLQGLLKGKDQISNIYLADNDVLYIPKADYFYIIGEVKNPGSYAFSKKDITIIEALSIAGGFTRIAARNKTRIVRIENGVERIYDVNVDAITKAGKMIQAVPVKPNDLIVVPESFF
ncbi:MAG: polysaccharide biosynthesis/export family protein [Deltaproteobacteria bacterium]